MYRWRVRLAPHVSEGSFPGSVGLLGHRKQSPGGMLAESVQREERDGKRG